MPAPPLPARTSASFLAPLARFAAPSEPLLGRQPMSARNHRHRCSRLQRLLDDPRLVVQCPTTTSAGTGDHLDAPDRPLRLKRRFKSRHKPIPISHQDQHHHRSRPRQKRRPQNTAYGDSVRRDNGPRRLPRNIAAPMSAFLGRAAKFPLARQQALPGRLARDRDQRNLQAPHQADVDGRPQGEPAADNPHGEKGANRL
jgi:hypothetical protein